MRHRTIHPMQKLRLPKPRNDAELAVLSEWYFDLPLSLMSLDVTSNYASYKVEQDYSIYHGEGFKYSDHDTKGYDHSAKFWEYVIGRLCCGGIARTSYGQANIIGHRNSVRLTKWMNSRRQKQAGHLRKPFIRLAERLRVRREHDDSR